MRRYLLDTGIAADFIFRRFGVADRVWAEMKVGNRIGVTTPVIGELFAGAENSQSRDENITILKRNILELLEWPFNRAAAEEFGRIFADLRKRGRTIQQIDIQVAAVAISLGNCVVVTKDSDFKAIPGLKIEDWSKTNS